MEEIYQGLLTQDFLTVDHTNLAEKAGFFYIYMEELEKVYIQFYLKMLPIHQMAWVMDDSTGTKRIF